VIQRSPVLRASRVEAKLMRGRFNLYWHWGQHDDSRSHPWGRIKPLEEGRYYVVAGRMGSGIGEVQIELFISESEPVASKPFPVNPKANSSKMAIGQERDATNHPGKESFDGELARFLIYERPLTDDELRQTMDSLKNTYAIRQGPAGRADSDDER
jgi:hypothetical protein